MIKTTTDLSKLVEKYYSYLKKNKFKFDEDLPFFTKEMFLDKIPTLITPFDHRNHPFVKNPKETVICHYCADSRIYPRLENVFEEIPEYKKFMGVIACDVTVTKDMDEEWRKVLILLNLLYLAVLACNGIKITPNFRIGKTEDLQIFRTIPANVMWASDFLGCEKIKQESDFEFLSKVMFVRASEVLVYGKKDLIVNQQLNNAGVPYYIFKDYHRLTKEQLYG